MSKPMSYDSGWGGGGPSSRLAPAVPPEAEGQGGGDREGFFLCKGADRPVADLNPPAVFLRGQHQGQPVRAFLHPRGAEDPGHRPGLATNTATCSWRPRPVPRCWPRTTRCRWPPAATFCCSIPPGWPSAFPWLIHRGYRLPAPGPHRRRLVRRVRHDDGNAHPGPRGRRHLGRKTAATAIEGDVVRLADGSAIGEAAS